MFLKTITGVTKDTIRSTKGFEELMLGCSRSLDQLTNETIDIQIERANGNNELLIQNVPLAEFILASVQGADSIQSDADFPLIAICELGDDDGNIPLQGDETILITLNGLAPLQTYEFHGIESAISAKEFIRMERKTAPASEVLSKFSVAKMDLMVTKLPASVHTISFHFENNKIVDYTPKELKALQRKIDPIAAINIDGTVLQDFAAYYVLPLVTVAYLEFKKTPGDDLAVMFRSVH